MTPMEAVEYLIDKIRYLRTRDEIWPYYVSRSPMTFPSKLPSKTTTYLWSFKCVNHHIQRAKQCPVALTKLLEHMYLNQQLVPHYNDIYVEEFMSNTAYASIIIKMAIAVYTQHEYYAGNKRLINEFMIPKWNINLSSVNYDELDYSTKLMYDVLTNKISHQLVSDNKIKFPELAKNRIYMEMVTGDYMNFLFPARKNSTD